MLDKIYTRRGKKMSVAAFPVIFQRIYFQPNQRNVADPMQRAYLEALAAI
jgi:hypothetical protein